MHRLVVLCALVLVSVRTGTARADDTHQEGAYNGAKPGGAAGKPDKPPPPNTLAWIGFEAKDGTSTLWLQAASAMQVAGQKVSGRQLIVSVTGISKLGKNTWRFVDMRFFDTPLSRAVAKRRKGKIEVRISFKNGKSAQQAQVRTATESDGLNYVYLSFSGGGSGDTVTPATPEDKPVEKPQ